MPSICIAADDDGCVVGKSTWCQADDDGSLLLSECNDAHWCTAYDRDCRGDDDFWGFADQKDCEDHARDLTDDAPGQCNRLLSAAATIIALGNLGAFIFALCDANKNKEAQPPPDADADGSHASGGGVAVQKSANQV